MGLARAMIRSHWSKHLLAAKLRSVTHALEMVIILGVVLLHIHIDNFSPYLKVGYVGGKA